MFVEQACLRFERVMQFFYKAPLFLQVGRLHARVECCNSACKKSDFCTS